MSKIIFITVLIFFMTPIKECRAESQLPSYVINSGVSLEVVSPGTLNDFWTEGLNIGAGIRLPYSLSREYDQFWLSLAYNYFPFDKDATFPIGSFYEDTSINLFGKSVHVFTAIIDYRIFFVNKSKIVIPYISFGWGFLGRSKTDMRSDSIILPEIKIGYKGAGLFTMAFGSEINLFKKFMIIMEIKYIQANTRPGKTTFAPFILGLEF